MTPEEITTDIIVTHEKQKFSEVSDDFKATVLGAVSRATRYLYFYQDWTFRIAYLSGESYVAAGGNDLPDDFLSFNQTGAVFWNNSGTIRELKYAPMPEIIRLLKGPQGTQNNGQPQIFSLGGPLDGASNQREIFIYPNVNCTYDLAYQATSPGPFEMVTTGNANSWEDEIPRIPISWHYVIREMAIVFRLIDKEGDSSRYQELLKTCMKTMMDQEPHGREATNIKLPKKLWWRIGRR